MQKNNEIVIFETEDNQVLSRLARFYTEFEGIHPFIDGNGRTGRLLVNLELMKAGYPPIDIKFADRGAYHLRSSNTPYSYYFLRLRNAAFCLFFDCLNNLKGNYILGRLRKNRVN